MIHDQVEMEWRNTGKLTILDLLLTFAFIVEQDANKLDPQDANLNSLANNEGSTHLKIRFVAQNTGVKPHHQHQPQLHTLLPII